MGATKKILLGPNGFLHVHSNNSELISSPFILKTHIWYQFDLSVFADGELKLTISSENKSYTGSVQSKVDMGLIEKLQFQNEVFQVAGCEEHSGESFNGKIEAPRLIVNGDDIAAWNFEESIQSLHVKASIGPDLVLKNSPTRGVTGQKWNGTEFCWKHKPSHYAAIYFHEDDIYDFGWKPDFELVIPKGMPSGAYFMRIEAEGHYDCIPFFVSATLGKPKADLCLLISTFTYTIYGNHARPDYDQDWIDKTKNGMLTRITPHILLIMDCRLTIIMWMVQGYAMRPIKGCFLICDLVTSPLVLQIAQACAISKRIVI